MIQSGKHGVFDIIPRNMLKSYINKYLRVYNIRIYKNEILYTVHCTLYTRRDNDKGKKVYFFTEFAQTL